MKNFTKLNIFSGRIRMSLLVLWLSQGFSVEEVFGKNSLWIERDSFLLEAKRIDIASMVLRQEIRGTVLDENGEPLIGVSILEKGTNNGTVTDLDGQFTIEVKDANSVLVFSYVGYERQEITVNNQSEINVSMVADNTLEQVVVTALGIERDKRDLGYSVSDVRGDDL